MLPARGDGIGYDGRGRPVRVLRLVGIHRRGRRCLTGGALTVQNDTKGIGLHVAVCGSDLDLQHVLPRPDGNASHGAGNGGRLSCGGGTDLHGGHVPRDDQGIGIDAVVKAIVKVKGGSQRVALYRKGRQIIVRASRSRGHFGRGLGHFFIHGDTEGKGSLDEAELQILHPLDVALAVGGGHVGHILMPIVVFLVHDGKLLEIRRILTHGDVAVHNEEGTGVDGLIGAVPALILGVDHTVVGAAVGTDIKEIVVILKARKGAEAASGAVPAHLLNTAGDQVEGADPGGLCRKKEGLGIADLLPVGAEGGLPLHKASLEHRGDGLLRLRGGVEGELFKLEDVVFV